MIALAEYRSLAAALRKLGIETEAKTAVRLENVVDKQKAIAIAHDIADEYVGNYYDLLQQGLLEAATTIAKTQVARAGVVLDTKELAANNVLKQLEHRYWGLKLGQRLLINERRLMRNISRSGQLGIQHLAKVYTHTVPFGAQINIDKRVLLGSIVKLERDIAQTVAHQTEDKLLRWELSERHSQPDACDDLATNVDEAVVQYLGEHNIDEDPKGLYFSSNFPDPPHPNCQCNHNIVTRGREGTTGAVHRAISAIRRIINRLRGK